MSADKKIVYRDDCPIGKRYIMNTQTWKMNNKHVLPEEVRSKHKFVEVRNPQDSVL